METFNLDDNNYSQAEKFLLLRWRSLKTAVLEIVYQDCSPVTSKIPLSNLIERLPVTLYQITPQEKAVFEAGRSLAWGMLALLIQNGVPEVLEDASFASWKLSDFPEDIELK